MAVRVLLSLAFVTLLFGVSQALAQAASGEALRERFVGLITRTGEERCAEISYFEPHERDSIYEYWDARCVSGREYRILLPRIAQAKAEAVPCDIPGARRSTASAARIAAATRPSTPTSSRCARAA